MEALQKLFSNEVQDLYDAEQQILKALPKMIEGSTSTALQEALQDHLAVTEKQVTRLEQILSEMGEKSHKKCKGMAGIIAEGDEMLNEDLEDSTMDAGIIGAAQKVEHYEIASYGTARTLAEYLGNSRAVQLLEETLEEEKEADALLTRIAESSINSEAASEEEESGEKAESNGRGRSRSSSNRSSKSNTAAKSKGRNQRNRRRTRAKATR
jgi:ferritin-like metal-binding protein YciE